MGPTATRLKYKKVRNSINYAISALAYAQKCLKDVSEDNVQQSVNGIVRKLSKLSEEVRLKDKKHQIILDNIKALEELNAIYSTNLDDKSILEILSNSTVLANKIIKTIK